MKHQKKPEQLYVKYTGIQKDFPIYTKELENNRGGKSLAVQYLPKRLPCPEKTYSKVYPKVDIRRLKEVTNVEFP